MTAFLRQSTAETVTFGPFVDDTDGKTAETGLTISQADIRLSKNGAAFAQTNNAAGATHMENGYFSVPLNATDTNTLGRLRVAVSESGALPVWRDFMVMPANAWDSLFGADRLQIHVDEMTAGIITAAVIGTDAIDADAIADGAINAAAIAADALTAAKFAADVTTELQSGLATAASIAALNNLSAAQVNAEVDTALADYDPPTRSELASDIASLAQYIDTEVATIVAGVAAILADTGTDGVVISQATREAIADAILLRSATNTQDDAARNNLTQVILAMFESEIALDGAVTIRKTTGATYETKQATLDVDAVPITGIT